MASLYLHLLFHLEMSPTWTMLIKSTFLSLSFWRNITSPASLLSGRMEPHLSIVQTDGNHSPSRAHNFSTLSHFLCFNWKQSLSFFLFLHLLIQEVLTCYTSVQWERGRRQVCDANKLLSASHLPKGTPLPRFRRSSSGPFLLGSLRLTVFSVASQLPGNRAKSANVAGTSL